MTAPAGVLDYFATEAAACLDRIERWLAEAARDPATPADDARRAARTLRGAAGVASEPAFAELGLAAERVLSVLAERRSSSARAAVAAAVAVAREALGTPAPRPDGTAERLRAVAATLDALATPAASVAAGTATGPADTHAVPIRALAREGDREFVVYRAAHPPTTADRRFRDASVPIARAIRALVAGAQTTGGGDAAPATQALGAALRAALVEVRELAESYDVAPAATFFARREAGAAALDPRTLAAVDAAAAGLAGEAGVSSAPAAVPEGVPNTTDLPSVGQSPNAPADVSAANALVVPSADTTPGTASVGSASATGTAPEAPRPDEPAAPEPQAGALVAPSADAPPAAAGERVDGFRPPTGEALVALLETGISGLGAIGPLDLSPTHTTTADDGAHGAAPADPDAVVPIETLLYHGRAALDRARAVRDALRACPGPPDPALLAELYDLLDLAAA